jgi:hypothetical protein
LKTFALPMPLQFRRLVPKLLHDTEEPMFNVFQTRAKRSGPHTANTANGANSATSSPAGDAPAGSVTRVLPGDDPA